MRCKLESLIAGLGEKASWADIIADLDSLSETEIHQDGIGLRLHSVARPSAAMALRALGIVPPATIEAAGDDE